MSKTSPIATAYQALLKKGRLQPNPSQAQLVQQLGRLQNTLLSPTGSQTWKTRLTSKPHTDKDNAATANNGIYIYGGVGTGKSRIADLFAGTLPPAIPSRRIHFHEFMLETHARLHRVRSQSSSFAADPLIQIGRAIQSESSVLCLDEFQVSDIADAMILQRLFGAFWAVGGVMVSTSNRHPTELYLNGLNRGLFVPFIRELERRCVVWRMEGSRDYRVDHVGAQGRIPVFFTDPRAFQKSLEVATGGAAMKETEIEVMMGRKMKVLAAKPGVGKDPKAIVQGSFATLCETSLGPSDYHALCSFASTIYVSGLYRFRSSLPQLDYVRRLITLVDIAYEYRTRVVCLSDAPLAEIFQEIGIDSEAAEAAEATLSGQRPASEGLNMTVKGEGGSSSSMMSTFVNGNVEWSATGLRGAYLAADGAGETDVKFAVGRAISRLTEMGSDAYGVGDD